MLIWVIGCEAQISNNANSTNTVLFEQYESLLTAFKKKEKIEGLAFAIFERNDIIWQKCLGKSTYGYPIDNNTLFSIQSISKNMTALAVMRAVQDSLLDLDLPISNYLPEFKINSCFEDLPERKITLRLLLSHTAGFTHEAPIGNNYEFTPCNFDDHINSIGYTWLKFPVGTNYSYSNLGFDLAAIIVERVSGLKFEDYLKTYIFKPSGMKISTIDDNQVLENNNKTEGTIPSTKTKHYIIPLLGSGAVYASLSDLTNYIQLQMNYGDINGMNVIDKRYLNLMYTINYYNYGLGTYIDKSDNGYYINHNGSGYGYSATFLWYPEFNIAGILLCNGQFDTFSFCESVLNAYVKSSNIINNETITDELNRLNGNYFLKSDEINDIKRQFCSNDTLYKDDWKKYEGTYAMVFKGLEFKWYAKLAFSFGFHPQKVFIKQVDQTLRINSNLGESILREYQPGVFFTNGGERIDFTHPTITYRNIELKKL